MSRTFACLLAITVASAVNAGCGDAAAVCSLDDDCRALSCEQGQIPQCAEGLCGCADDVFIGDIGRFQSMALIGSTAYMCAYNNTYGDLMIGSATPHAVVSNWSFVDGVPEDGVPQDTLSQVRGGVIDKGDDVGRYCSLSITPAGDPIVSYYDRTHGTLRFGSFGAVRWHNHTVDQGMGLVGLGGDDIGRWTSLTIAPDGSPGIAYFALVAKGASGGPESQVRFAQATRPNPELPSDWVVTIVDKKPLPTYDMNNPAPTTIPDGVGLFVQSARKADGAPVLVYYDNGPSDWGPGLSGNLVMATYDPGTKTFTKQVLDGEVTTTPGVGYDTGDVGWYPSISIGPDDVAHVSYVDASHDNLLYVNTKTLTPEVVDDGYRPSDETTLDGLPAPAYHLVGDSSSIALRGDTVVIAYQDSTVAQLRLAQRDPAGSTWKLDALAGHATPFTGSYGFYAQAEVSGDQAVVSSYAINQHLDTPSFYVEVFGVTLP